MGGMCLVQCLQCSFRHPQQQSPGIQSCWGKAKQPTLNPRSPQFNQVFPAMGRDSVPQNSSHFQDDREGSHHATVIQKSGFASAMPLLHTWFRCLALVGGTNTSGLLTCKTFFFKLYGNFFVSVSIMAFLTHYWWAAEKSETCIKLNVLCLFVKHYLSWRFALGKMCRICLCRYSSCCTSGVSLNFISKKYPLPNLLFRCWTVPIHLPMAEREKVVHALHHTQKSRLTSNSPFPHA